MIFTKLAVCVAVALLPPSDRRGIAMSDQSSSGKEHTGSSKKPVSPMRKFIGLVVLLAVLVIGGLEVWAKTAYTMAVKALDARSQDENQGLLAVNEAEILLGRAADGPGTDVTESLRTFTKKTYTWRGLLKSYTVTAFYTEGADPRLHHFETEGAKFVPEPQAARPQPAPATNEPTAAIARPGVTKEPTAATPEPAATKEPTAATPKPATAPAPTSAELTPAATKAPDPAKPNTAPAPDPSKVPK
jgi:hypothetical protein